MAVAYDNDTQSLQLAATNTTTFAHVTSGADRAIVVYVALVASAQTVSTITYGGQSLGLIYAYDDTWLGGRIEAWGLANCPTGSNNVVVTLSANSAAWDVSAISFTGAHQTGGTTTFNGAQVNWNAESTALASVAITSATDAMVVSGTLSTQANGTAPSGGGTQRWLDNSGSTNTQGSTWPGAASVTVTENWDATRSVGYFKVLALNVSATAAGAPPALPGVGASSFAGLIAALERNRLIYPNVG